jgi:hypothetical protein
VCVCVCVCVCGVCVWGGRYAESDIDVRLAHPDQSFTH